MPAILLALSTFNLMSGVIVGVQGDAGAFVYLGASMFLSISDILLELMEG